MTGYACAPINRASPGPAGATPIRLYGGGPTEARAGKSLYAAVRKRRVVPDARAWDFLSVALSVVTADNATLREPSPDGWTREIELDVAVTDPDLWSAHSGLVERALAFLTTDRWTMRFHSGGLGPPRPPSHRQVQLRGDGIVLLSGGLDSLIGAIDLRRSGNWCAVSQVAPGDGRKQVEFARRLGLDHLQLNHVSKPVGKAEQSQRSRSIAFLAFGAIAATSLACWQEGADAELAICENGYIAINPPLTDARLGSLSTRTAHPEFLSLVQALFDVMDMRIRLTNPYALQTKGEMLERCVDQALIRELAARSTSCGRFRRFGYRHCGRCVPCQVRRAAFLAWGQPDQTGYVYETLGTDDGDHARHDDVRSVATAIGRVGKEGLDRWLGTTLSIRGGADRDDLQAVAGRGLDELRRLHEKYGVA